MKQILKNLMITAPLIWADIKKSLAVATMAMFVAILCGWYGTYIELQFQKSINKDCNCNTINL